MNHHSQHDHSHSHSQDRHVGSHHNSMIKDFEKRLWIASALSLPVLLISPMIQSFFSLNLSFQGDKYILFILASTVFLYGGWPFLKGMKNEVQQNGPGMMTLIGVAITVAYIYSSAVVFGLGGKMFFWELVTLIDIMLLGHWIEMRSVKGASRALEMLVSMMPSDAHKIHGDHIMDIPLEELQKGDIILVKPGEKIPADGSIQDGESHINESMLTGESIPIKKGLGQSVIGGSINGNGSLRIKVEKSTKDSYLNKVITLVEEAQKVKSKTQHLADKAAKWLTYLALGFGFITLSIWLILGFDFVFALERMVSVMVISCPHALGLAIPLVVAISTAISAQNGLLIRNRTAFENARKISTLVFDKTGTLTKGEFGVTRLESVSDKYSPSEILMLAAALEQNSEHPIAIGIMKKAESANITIPQIQKFNSITGKGVQAEVEGQKFMVMSPGFLEESGIEIPKNAFRNDEVETVVFVLTNNQLIGFLSLSDEIRSESREAIATFKRNGIKVLMATGDNKNAAEAISKKLNLDDFYAEVLPHQKVEIVKHLQSEGEFVAMTGDGVNDAPALAQSDIGIAVGSGTDVAAETADIILVNSSPLDILNLIQFAKATYKKMIQNLMWATTYNVIAIPLAAGVLYGIGFVLNPAVGAVLMSLSTVVVAINAYRLKYVIKNI